MSQPGDAHEQEADRVAERVTGTQSSAAAATGQPLPAHQAQSNRAEASVSGDRIGQRIAGSRDGTPLPEATRAFMEPRLGADLSAVRVHSGRNAQALNAELHARAFTFGPDIWLGADASVHDRKLMAHELTHVLQQSARRPYIARQRAASQPDADKHSAANNAPAASATPSSYPGCDAATTGIADAAAVLDRARAGAMSAVAAARAAFNPMKSATVLLLDQHFHCPSIANLMEIKKTLAAIEAAIPALAVNCLKPNDPDCADSMGNANDNVKALDACPAYFGAGATDLFRILTFIFAGAVGIGRTARCRRAESCYDDFTQPAPVMLNNPYSYAWFAVEAAGLSAPVPGIVPCRPLETGIHVVVSPAAKKDPTQIRRLIGTEPVPKDAEIIPVYLDTSDKYFIYHDDIEGAKAYLPGESKRYYFPDGKRP